MKENSERAPCRALPAAAPGPPVAASTAAPLQRTPASSAPPLQYNRRRALQLHWPLLLCCPHPLPQYNRDAPRIYNTVQCYLKDSRGRLLDELERARREVGPLVGPRLACTGRARLDSGRRGQGGGEGLAARRGWLRPGMAKRGC